MSDNDEAERAAEIEELVGEAYEIGHAHGSNPLREVPARVNEGWGPIALKIQKLCEARAQHERERILKMIDEWCHSNSYLGGSQFDGKTGDDLNGNALTAFTLQFYLEQRLGNS